MSTEGVRIALFCQFEEDTACGIVMAGKGAALATLDCRVDLVYHPFKFARAHATRASREGALDRLTVYSGFFGARGARRWLALPALLLRDVPRVLRRLRRAEVVVLQKTLPLAALYAVLLRVTRHRGKRVCLLDDWDGVGGMATVRHPDSAAKRILVTALEEWLPTRMHGVACASRLLQERYALSPRLAPRVGWFPTGAAPLPHAPPRPRAGAFRVGYVGTYKSPALTAFLARVVTVALERDPDLRFDLLGGGDCLGQLREALAAPLAAGQVRIPGQVPHAEALDALDSFDLCLMALNDRFPEHYLEAARSSTKLFEYMATGRAVLASDAGEPAHLLRDGETAWLAPNRPDAFAEKILRARADRAACAAMGARLREEFEARYTHRKVMREFLAWARALPPLP